MYAAESDIFIEMLAVKEGYRYEYQGDCVQPVWYKTLEKTIYNFFTAFTMKYFPLLNGTFSCGKSTALVETCRLIAQNLVTRNITSVSEPKVIEKVILYFANSYVRYILELIHIVYVLYVILINTF